MREIFNPIAASDSIVDSFKRYLRTTFWSRDESLNHEFRNALDSSFQLSRGPILQAAAPYVTGATIRSLVDEGALRPEFLNLKHEVLPPDRPLYRHQEEAIRKVQKGRNLIVATGTGSGKTESFLLPILDHLLREKEAGTLDEPGVRAMLLYPMNALANDQLKRIRELLGELPDITFGRYIGATEHTYRQGVDAHVSQFGDDPLPNELVSREQMQERPPHILVTNYAMLEYLLLRPKDTPLFDGKTGGFWRFIVLDEVHVYNGAQGAEIGMLLRRVRDRVNGSQQGRIQCIGTSATLGGGAEGLQDVVAFAENLFDEKFEYELANVQQQDVVLPQRQSLVDTEPRWKLDARIAKRLVQLTTEDIDLDELRVFLESAGAPNTDGDSREEILGAALHSELMTSQILRSLEQQPLSVMDLVRADSVDATDPEFIVDVVTLGTRATSPQTKALLIPARYHLFLRGLWRALMCFSDTHPAGTNRLHLEAAIECRECAREQRTSTLFEIGACAKCGDTYILGKEVEGKVLLSLSTTPAVEDYYWLVQESATSERPVEDEDEAAILELPESDSFSNLRVSLCTGCGSNVGQATTCPCDYPNLIRVSRANIEQGAVGLSRCISCSGRRTGSIVMRYTTFRDAPPAVIATSLYQSLPPGSADGDSAKVGQARRMLSFADSRQDAAFFAGYLEQTYRRAVERGLLWSLISEADEDGARTNLLVSSLKKRAEGALFIDPFDHEGLNLSTAWHWIMREILSVDRRHSLDGVGLAEVAVVIPPTIEVPVALTKMGFTKEEALDLARVLLESLRLQAAVTLPDSVDIKDPMFAPRNTYTWVRREKSDSRVLSWIPGVGMNARLEFLSKVLQRKGIPEDPRDLLGKIWSSWLTDPKSGWAAVLDEQKNPIHGTVFQLKHTALTFIPISATHQPFHCRSCGRVWWRSIAAVCPSWKCQGSLQELDSTKFEDNHYRHLYESLKPLAMAVEEHTAAIEAVEAAGRARKFISGDVNVLSSSTTFELGVDVGDVQAVLLRNMPPTPSNYIQRAGRAGRRPGSSPLIVTFAQKRPHDEYYFNYVSHMVEGNIPSPIVSLANGGIARRHIHAVALAEFQRQRADSDQKVFENADEFFLQYGGLSGYEHFRNWLESKPDGLKDAILRILPQSPDWSLAQELGIPEWRWVSDLFNDDDAIENTGWLFRAYEEIVSSNDELKEEIERIRSRISDIQANNPSKSVANLQSQITTYERVKDTLIRKRLIQYLAQRVVLPKYGFPVDVRNLNVWRSSKGGTKAARVELSRDLTRGIVEFAPGTKVVADKSLWVSQGLVRPPGKEFIRYTHFKCKTCDMTRVERMDALSKDDQAKSPCPHCQSTSKTTPKTFVVPDFGFFGELDAEKLSDARPASGGLAMKSFTDYAKQAPEFLTKAVRGRDLKYRFSRQGQILVTNSGKYGLGFRICNSCGTSTPAPLQMPSKGKRKVKENEPHTRPGSGKECRGFFFTASLGHQFLTDVVELDLGRDCELDELKSAMYALIAASRILGIVPGDIDGILNKPGTADRTIVILDSVPGGAGHVRRIIDGFEQLIDAAVDLVSGCSCDIDTSCYSCLRSYSNQFESTNISRQGALSILRRFKETDAP